MRAHGGASEILPSFGGFCGYEVKTRALPRGGKFGASGGQAQQYTRSPAEGSALNQVTFRFPHVLKACQRPKACGYRGRRQLWSVELARRQELFGTELEPTAAQVTEVKVKVED